MTPNRFARGLLVTSIFLLVALVEPSKQVLAEDPHFEVYGYAQADYIQDYKRVHPDWEDTLRPSRIPTQDGQYGGDGQASLSAKQSRLGVKSNLPVGTDDSVFAQFEFDLFGVGEDEGQTTFRARHIFGEYGQILGGQTNSLFMDGDIFPNILDYWGPAGMVFLRNPQLRWTPFKGTHNFAVAIEKPGDDIDAGNIREFDPALGENIKSDEELPDFTAQYRYKEDWGHFQGAGIVRRIGYETRGVPGNEPEGSEVGWGANLTTAINVLDDDFIRLGGVVGEGIASYMNDGGTDLAPEGTLDNLEPEAVFLWGISAYYDLRWNDEFTTSFGYARTQVDNTSFQSEDAFKAGDYASINLLYTPVKDVMFGVEVLWGSREDNNGDSGDDIRSQVSAKYSFSSTNFWPPKRGA